MSDKDHKPEPMLVHRIRDEDDDEEQFKPLEWGLVRRMIGYSRPVRGKLITMLILTLIRAAQLPALVWVTALVIKGPIAHKNIHGILLGTAGYVALAVMTDFMFHFRQRYALEIGETVVNGMRSDIFDKTLRQPMSFFHRMKLGRILSRVTSDVEAVRVGIQDVGFVSAIQAGQMFFAGVVLAVSDWKMFLVVVCMAPVLWLVNNHFRMKFSRLTRAAQESFSRVTATLAESVNGIRVTQGFVRQETNAGLFRSLLSDHSRYNIALARSSAVLAPILELNSQFFVATLLVVGGWRIFHGTLQADDLIMYFLMANIFFSPITIIGNQYNQGLLAMASAERIFRLIDTPPDWVDSPNAEELPNPRTAAVATAVAGARVEFRNVSFGYDPTRLVLHEVNFVAAPGQTIALVGHTGSGKSSIINLVSKFYLPTSGEILVDGREIRSITGRSLHAQMGTVQQQNFLFSGTILENILLSRPDATREDVVEAARKLDCSDMLAELPNGLDTVVGERGSGLSVGQRQLVCFIRAMLPDPRIVILDEATSSIDAMTEARLQRALALLLKERTSFVVAHRLSTIRGADLVLVLDQGRVIERGTHPELLALGGHYAALYKQFVQVDDRR
ncbi:MAG TPA: ABC transporter ATP-binding protein [Opitutaceae bacterium]|jgi:ATP-binding cassette subfamily B protein|nr:ABC transporter ATP-binding protein [Opitutaceae bacterium]